MPESNAPAPDWQAYLEYWQLDALVVQVLTAKLGPGPAAHIPSATEIATQRRTARQIYQMLSERYSGSDYADGLVQKMKLRDYRYTGGLGPSLEKYINMWKDGIDLLHRCRYPYMVPDAAIHFVLHGPMQLQIWSRLQSDVMTSIAQGGLDNKWLDDFFRSVSSDMRVHAITQRTADQFSRTQSSSFTQNPHRQIGNQNSSSKRVCDDCNKKGYTRCPIDGGEHCEHHHRQGGVRKPTTDSNSRSDTTSSSILTLKTKVLAAVAVPMDDPGNNLLQVDAECADDTVTFAVSGNKIDIDTYYVGVDCYPESVTPARQATAFLTSDPITLHELQSTFQAVLDSACTYHLVRDRSLFWTYRPEDAVDVGTANSGYLHTEAKGLVKLEVEIEGEVQRRVIIMLHDCLHAPRAPLNLLSVGAFLESRMPISFDEDGFARVHFPSTHSSLSGKCFHATLRDRLAFLRCRFIPPPSPIPTDPSLPSKALAYVSFTP